MSDPPPQQPSEGGGAAPAAEPGTQVAPPPPVPATRGKVDGTTRATPPPVPRPRTIRRTPPPSTVPPSEETATHPLAPRQPTPPPPPTPPNEAETAPAAPHNKQPIKQIVCVENGLQLKTKSKVLKAFSYALAPGTETINPVRKKVLVVDDTGVQGDHVVLHQLQPSQKLVDVVTQTRQHKHAKAVVIVNTSNSLKLETVHQEGYEGGSYPVLIVSKPDGREIIRIIEAEEDDVMCDVEAESAVDAPSTNQNLNQAEVVTDQPRSGALKANGSQQESKTTGFSRFKKSSGLKGELKKLMFSGDNVLPLSDDSAKFCMVMSVFDNYERTGKPDSGFVREVFYKINKTLDSIFLEDFPFYVILAYRIHVRMSMYQSDESQSFIMSCIQFMEDGPAVQIAKTLNRFLAARDFSIMFSDSKNNCSVFHLLELAFVDLCKISFNTRQSFHVQKKPTSTELYDRFIYNTMAWVSLSLRVRSHRGAMTRTSAKPWKDHLISRSHLLSLNNAQVDCLKSGLQFGRAIELPKDLRLNVDLMCDMLVPRHPSTTTVRYFTHLTYFFKVLHSSLSPEDMLIILVYLRGVYIHFFGSSGYAIDYRQLSPKQTLLGTLTEGLEFLNQVSMNWPKHHKERKTRTMGRGGSQNEVTNQDITKQRSAELWKWIELLLGLIDVTADKADSHLKLFVKGKGVVAKEFQKEIQDKVVDTTRENFPRLPIQRFFPLYEAFMIWPTTFLEDYLIQYKVPGNVKISDATWTEFFSGVAHRFSGAHSHYFINDFLQLVADKYRESGRAKDFVLDLLKLRVKTLLGIVPDEEEGEMVTGKEVQQGFKQFLQTFIKRNALRHQLIREMTNIMDSITTEMDEFQGLVLSVLKKEIVPEFKVLQGEESLSNTMVKGILNKSVTELVRNLSWLTAVSPKQSFCWGIVAACCCKVPVRKENLAWLHDYDYLINQLCHIYKAYCNGLGMKGEEDKQLKDPLPKEVLHDDDIRLYFEWVRQVQTVVFSWHERMKGRELNFDEIMVYANFQGCIQAIGDAISASSSFLELQIIQQRKNWFLQYFEQLNILLLRYIPGKPEVKWCTLPQLLADNGVAFPPLVGDLVTNHVVFPGEKKAVEGGLLENELTPCTLGNFKPGQDISLKLSKGLMLKDLLMLVTKLQSFLEPILDRIDMLVFFVLHNSVMFKEYQKLYLSKEVEELKEKLRPPALSVTSTFGAFPSVSVLPPPGGAAEEKDTLIDLPIVVRSLERTKAFLIKLIEGSATYHEIIAEGRLDLQNLDIDLEFDILEQYIHFHHLKPTLRSEVGLRGVRCMLELFQYQSHIMKIRDVCEQYKLKGCLEDQELKALVELAEELGPEKSRRELTLNEAIAKVNRATKLLFSDEKAKSQCLKLFDAVADSAAFYQFIKDKKFSGPRGKAVFTQQFQLITAQLQHEEYQEEVLNHLVAAYNFMLPFMNTDQSFRNLMDEVVDLDMSNDLKQLVTVNSNITLIQLWFSRAEGDTLQNVANELECIIETGFYIFTISSEATGGEAIMNLEYLPSARQNLPPVSNEEGGGGGGGEGGRRSLVSSGSFQETGVANGTQLVRKKESWTREQINDFVRKLGFLDTQKEGGDKIKHFLHINEVANKLLDLHVQLKDLGHPKYLTSVVTRMFDCITSSKQADGEVADVQQMLTAWDHSVRNYRHQHLWLLFCSVPKQLLLFQMIEDFTVDTQDEVAQQLVREVMFLVKNDPTVRDELKQNILTCLPVWHRIINNFTAMEIVGGFLGDLLQNHDLPRRTTKHVRRVSSASLFPGVSDTNQFLHHAPKYTQSQLVRLIVNIYGGVPESFEVFHCRDSTTQEELGLFLERVEKRPSLRYLILEVNKLPFRLQENLMQCYLKIQRLARRRQAEKEQLVQNGEQEGAPPTTITTSGSTSSSSSSEGIPKATVISTSPAKYSLPTLHFVETAPSVLRELPWIIPREHKEDGPTLTFSGAQQRCKAAVTDFVEIQLVYGRPGDGKTHYIKEQLRKSYENLTIAVNEAFTPLGAIKKLRKLNPNQRDCAVFLNFTMLPPGESVDESEDRNYKELMKIIGWFFFDLFLLGYVEDPVTGLSVSIPGGMDWKIYVEVPSRISSESPEESLAQFIEEVPALGMLGVPHAISHNTPYTVDKDVQLVCKYLNAYWECMDHSKARGINKLYREIQGRGKLVRFSFEPDLSQGECHRLLKKSWADFDIHPKVTQKLFIRYMKRRCAFLDELPAFNYNTGYGEYYYDELAGKNVTSDTRELGSTLMSTMLQEVKEFCNPEVKENWSLKAHQQLIYDFKDGGSSFGLLCLNPDDLPKQKTKFEKIRVLMPSMMELHGREILDSFLSRALDIELDSSSKRLSVIDTSNYVLTLDYTVKMLNIHERYECGVPVIIEGETGVGKTALVEMLSKLWNQALLSQWRKKKEQILDIMRRTLGDLNAPESGDDLIKSLRWVEDLSEDKLVKLDDLIILCQLPDVETVTMRYYTTLRAHMLALMENHPIISLLTHKGRTKDKRSLKTLFKLCRNEDTAETTASLLQAVMVAEIESTFHKINVHAALTPIQIGNLIKPALEQAEVIRNAYENYVADDRGPALRLPCVTVFLDEVNTSSCLGLFKEIIVDHTFDGECLPKNVFIVAACNPHRGNSLAAHAAETPPGNESTVTTSTTTDESWTRSTYYVRQLHPTLDFLKWDYGSLDESQERDYINAKVKMLNKDMNNVDASCLTDLIVKSQNLMRKYASEQLSATMSRDEAKVSARSCVSQRDIQRVFTFFQWFQKLYSTVERQVSHTDFSRRAILVSLGIVYYMRLNTKYRGQFKEFIDRPTYGGDIHFSKAFHEELDWFIGQMELPTGIAQTQALKENLFATIVCTATHTPLIIVGAPGSSKTLSFNLSIANLKGLESKVRVFRSTDIFHSLDPHFYQCSRRTTSNEIDTVFSRAINRQRSHKRFSLPIYCVVFMDEAGLPEESHESLKVLHYHLDKQEVSFVAITNHMLDAAKSNRAVCLFRPEASDKDLTTLARGCLSSKLDSPPPELERDLKLVVKFCPAFSQLMLDSTFRHFFGLRDFIHFVNYLRRRRGEGLNSRIVMEALERNFNGYEKFDKVAESFFNAMDCEYSPQHRRSILTVLKESLDDRPSQDGRDMSENEVRYKLIIDPSEDDSLIRLLFSLGVLVRENTRMYVCSDFPGDSQIQKINTIAAIRHSAIEGHTVVMSQTDDIHESFYDLFNQRFRRIDDQHKGPRYYTNIAIGAHLRPCRVHPNFQCVVVVKKSEVVHTPAPFLNRFEKYCITHRTLLETALSPLPVCLKIVLQAAQEKVEDFVEQVRPDGLYGFQLDTVNSLILSLLPPVDFKFNSNREQSMVDPTEEIMLYVLRLLIQCLRSCSGLHIPFVSLEELQSDAKELFDIVKYDPEFDGLMRDLDHHRAKDAIYEAVEMLHTAPCPDQDAERIELVNISPEGCLVVVLLQQWLVRHLTKRMMQLMTLESFTEHRAKIPSSYLENYLVHQAHFSLSSLIDKYLKGLANKWEPKFPTSKVLSFTRSSQLIHQLPAQYPSHALERQSKNDIQQTLKKLVYEDVDKLMVCKLSNVPSQSHVLELLRTFAHSETAEVLLLVVNMQEIKRQVMNHLRIMIEEEEAHLLKEDKKQKLFLLLLHFPPSKFANACYPSLFLRGWDHYYLDTVAHSTATGVLDIQNWLKNCCFPPETPLAPEDDPLITSLREILNEAVPILASRVFFGEVKNGYFNRSMNGSMRTKMLKTLLFDKGVGIVLCERFRSYWKPSVMSEYLEKAVAFTRSKDSTLNITDSIHTTFKSLFFDFLVYMISRINEDCNIDVLFQVSCTVAIQSLFLDIVRVFKVPKLTDLKVRSTQMQQGRSASLYYLPQFPFFKSVSGEMERLVEESREEANTKTNIVGDLDSERVDQSVYRGKRADKQSLIGNLKEIVVRKLEAIVENESTSFLAHFIKAQKENPEIWDFYFTDFIAHTLHLESSESIISQRILRTFFVELHQEKTSLAMVAQLHVYMNVFHLELAKMATVLRPLDMIQHVSRSAPNALSPLVTSPTKQLVEVVHQRKHPLGTPEHLTAFVVGHLFNALVGAAFGHKSPTSPNLINNPEKMLMWYEAYRDVMCLPSLKQHTYSALTPDATPAMVTVEARFNVMQTVFLTLRAFSDPARAEPSESLLADSQKILHTLFSRYFNVDMELRNGCPRLKEVSEVAMEIITQTGPNPPQERDINQIRLLMEGLFAHFFSADRHGYHEEDREWFLRLANQQEDWCVPNITDVVIGATSDQDLSDELQKSVIEREKIRGATLGVEVPNGAISMSIFKLYLSRLLGECDRQNEDPVRCGPLLLHQYHPRLQVGRVLLRDGTLGGLGPYIPTFYQECPAICPEQASLGRRMQQPLSHLYFLSVLEHILAEEQSLALMVKAARQLSDLTGASEPAQHAVLQIELQAVLQVIAKLLARSLGMPLAEERAQIVELKDSIEEINRLFGDVTTGGDRVGGHGLVVAHHLFKELKSSRKFIELMTTNFNARCKEIECLRPIHERLQQDPGEPTFHLLPFMQPVGGVEDDLKALYKKVKKAMIGIHKLNHTNNLKELQKIATECNSPRRMSGGHTARISNHCNFKMMMWLVIFYEFYDKGMQSPTLSYMIESEDFSRAARLRESEIRLFRCFLDHKLVHSKPEDPNPLRVDEEFLELAPGGGVRRKGRQARQKKADPVYDLFFPNKSKKIDQSDVDLRHAIANMVAVVLGCDPESNHLWYHLFDQEPLSNTYLTGFMYKSKINKDGLLYDCGVELDPDGNHGRQDYLKHANRGTYNLHSLYLLLWANFASFSVALLVLPDADRTIHGPLISEWLSVRHYCVSQLRTAWMHIRNNLGLSDEERSFLLMRCMKKFYEVVNSDKTDPEIRRGVFNTDEELGAYEKLWHSEIFEPSRDEMAEKFIQYSNIVFVEMRNLELRYPYYPTEQDFIHSVLSSGGVVCSDVAVLTSFSQQWQRLQVGGELLPDLVELYQWLHTDLAHLVTFDKACTVTIRSVINRAVRKYSPDMGQYLQQLFERVKRGYNKYVELIGGAIGAGACAAVRQGNKIYVIDDNMPLLHFLSDVEEEEEGNDWLFTVIADIIIAHNDMVELPRGSRQSFRRLLPQQESYAYPTEITATNCIIPPLRKLHGVNELLQLLRSRHRSILKDYSSLSPSGVVVRQQQTPTMSFTSNTTPSPSAPLFHLQELQEDIVSSFLAGKPHINHASALRTPFRFKITVPRALKHQTDVISSDELAAIRQRLPVELKGDMDSSLRKRLEFDFHPAGYHIMLATTTGLKTAAGHLVKYTIDDGLEALDLKQSLAQFLYSLYENLNSVEDAFGEIGIRMLRTNQMVCLSELPLVHLYHCLTIFAKWMEEGMYDFSSLPYTLKAHLLPDDLAALKDIPERWGAPLMELMSEVEAMNSLLSHIESYITTQGEGQTTQTSIIACLKGFSLISDEERLPALIPDTVLVQNFVELRIVLRGIMSEVQQKLDQEAKEKAAEEREPRHWKEVVDDIWAEHLPHFRGEVYTGDGAFLFDAAEGRYLFQDEENMSEEGEDDLLRGVEEEEKKESSDDDEFVEVREEGVSELQRAAEFTPQQVAEFLGGIGLGQYVQSFLEAGVDGETLLEARDEDLREVGVESRLHQVKIITIFKRLVTRQSKTELSVDDVVKFLHEQKMDAFVEAFRTNGIDGDILEAIMTRKEDKVMVESKGTETTVTDIILGELGMDKGMMRAKAKTKFRRLFVQDSLVSLRGSNNSGTSAQSTPPPPSSISVAPPRGSSSSTSRT